MTPLETGMASSASTPMAAATAMLMSCSESPISTQLFKAILVVLTLLSLTGMVLAKR